MHELLCKDKNSNSYKDWFIWNLILEFKFSIFIKQKVEL
jgi:hypothetical protein